MRIYNVFVVNCFVSCVYDLILGEKKSKPFSFMYESLKKIMFLREIFFYSGELFFKPNK